MSCSVSESIVFNEQMGGVFRSTFDMSQILAITNEGNVQEENEKPAKLIDTTIVFKHLLEEFKDSISGLPMDKQKQLYNMRDVIVDLQRDESRGVFNFTMHKPFANFEELQLINEQLDEALNLVQNLNEVDSAAPAPDEQMEKMTKSDPVIYSFSNNTFSRFQPKKEGASQEEGTEGSAEDAVPDIFKGQFDDLFKVTFYTMTYTFPKPIKSVSNKEAVISEDGKTMTFKTDLNAVNKDPELMSFEVVLED